MIKKTFFVGLNDKNTLKQEISTAQAIKKIKQVLFYNDYQYFTIANCQGVYVMNSNGESTQENTIEIIIVESFLNHLKHKKQIKNLINDLKQVLNQESILLLTQYTKSNLKF